MNFTLKYTTRNIKTNKLRVWLISLSTFIATTIFFFAFLFPSLVTNVKENSMREFYGNSDIYIMPNLDSLNEINSSSAVSFLGALQMKTIYDNEEIMDLFEYAIPLLALPGDIANDGAYIIFGNLSEINQFNPITFYGDETKFLRSNEIIVSRSYAEERNLSLGSSTTLYCAGESASFIVGGIAENQGLFSGINKEIIICPKTALRVEDGIKGPFYDILKISGFRFNELTTLFDIGLFKVKDGVDVNVAIAKLEKVFDPLTVSRTVDIDIIDDTINSILPLFLIGVAIICIFCAFILYYMSRMIIRDRSVEFARLKAMGAKNITLFFSVCLEILFYSLMGSILAQAVSIGLIYWISPSVIKIIPIIYYFYPFLCSLGLSLFAVLLQVPKFYKSISTNLINSEKYSVSKKIFVSLAIIANLGLLITLFCLPVGWSTTTIICYILFAYLSIYCLPLYFRLCCSFIDRFFPAKDFPTMYISRSAKNSHSRWLLRAITFGALTIFLLCIVNTTFKNYSSQLNSTDDYDIKISGVRKDFSDSLVSSIKKIDGVKNVYPATILSSVSINNKELPNVSLHAFSDNDTKTLYRQFTPPESLQKLSDKNQVLLGSYFQNVLRYSIGDKITIYFNKDKSNFEEFTIAGFIDNAKVQKTIIADISEINAINSVIGFNNVLVDTEDNQVNNVLSEIKSQNLSSSASSPLIGTKMIFIDNVYRSTNKTMDMFNTPFVAINILIYAIIFMCVITNFMCFVIFLKEMRKRYFIYHSMGLSNRYLRWLLSLQLAVFSGAGLLMSWIIISPLKTQSINILFPTKINMAIFPISSQLLLASIIYILAYVLLAQIFIPIIGRIIFNKESQQYKFNQISKYKNR